MNQLKTYSERNAAAIHIEIRLMDALARQFTATHDLNEKAEIDRLAAEYDP